MTEFELCSILAAMDMSKAEFARQVGKGYRSVRGYCSGERPIPILVQREARRLYADHERKMAHAAKDRRE